MLVQASVDIRVLKEAGLFGTVSVVCNGVVDGGVQGAGVFSNGCCGTILSTSAVPVHAVCRGCGGFLRIFTFGCASCLLFPSVKVIC